MHAQTASEPELSSPLGTASDWLVKNYYKKLFSSWDGQKKQDRLDIRNKESDHHRHEKHRNFHGKSKPPITLRNTHSSWNECWELRLGIR